MNTKYSGSLVIFSLVIGLSLEYVASQSQPTCYGRECPAGTTSCKKHIKSSLDRTLLEITINCLDDFKEATPKVINIEENHSSQSFDNEEVNLLNNGLKFGISSSAKVLEDIIASLDSLDSSMHYRYTSDSWKGLVREEIFRNTITGKPKQSTKDDKNKRLKEVLFKADKDGSLKEYFFQEVSTLNPYTHYESTSYSGTGDVVDRNAFRSDRYNKRLGRLEDFS